MKRMHANACTVRSLEASNSREYLKCPQCAIQLNKCDIQRFKNHYIEHLKQDADVELECLFQDCDFRFKKETTFHCHIRKHHSGLNSVVKVNFRACEYDDNLPENEPTIELAQNLTDELACVPANNAVAQLEPSNSSEMVVQNVTINYDKRMNDAYMSLYLSMNQIYQIPKYQCDEILKEFAYLQEIMLNKYRFEIQNAVNNYGFEQAVSQVMSCLVETSNSYLRAHDNLKYDSKKVD